MSDYKPLYKIKDNGKIYVWTIEFKEYQDKYYTYVTHGQKDGKMVEHIKEIVPKTKRNHKEQFEIIASRKWNDKIEKEGYSTIINNNNNSEKKSILIRPMLAQTFDLSKYQGNKKCKKIEFPCWGQPKFDGIRCLMYKKNDKIIMESRKGTEFHNFDILREEFMNTLSNEDCVFDGELYSFDMSFENLSGLVRLKKPKDTQIKDINTIKFYIYDVIIKQNLNATFNERKEYLENIMDKYKDQTNLINFCPSININEIHDINNIHDNYVQNGYEGLILRNYDGKYEVNKRSYNLQKYKKFMDEEFIIIDYTQGTGDEKGLIIFKCETKNKKQFSVRPRGTREYRSQLYKNGDNLIGKKLTVIFQEYSSDGIPRFPVGKAIRIDK